MQTSPILFFYLQISPILLFLQIGPLVLLFCRDVLKSDLVQRPRKQVQGQVSHFNWSKVHMAAYKRPVTVKVRKKEPQNSCHITNSSQISLSIQLRSNSQKNQKITRTRRTISTNPNFPRIKFKCNSMKFTMVLRDSSLNRHHWTISPAIQARIHHWKRRIQTRSQREEWEEEGRKNQKIWTGEEEEEEKLPIYFRIQAKESTNRIKFKS